MCHVFEHQIQTPGRGLDDIEELHDVGMRQFSQQRYFSNDVARDAALRRGIGVGDAFDGHGAIGGALCASVDGAVGSLSDEIGAVMYVCVCVIVFLLDDEDDNVFFFAKIDSIAKRERRKIM